MGLRLRKPLEDVLSGPQGTFELRAGVLGAEDAKLNVWVSKRGWLSPPPEEVAVGSKDLELVLLRPGVIEARVEQPPDLDPGSLRVLVYVRFAGEDCRLVADQVYRSKKLRPGSYWVRAEGKVMGSYVYSDRERVQVLSGETTKIQIDLRQ